MTAGPPAEAELVEDGAALAELVKEAALDATADGDAALDGLSAAAVNGH